MKNDVVEVTVKAVMPTANGCAVFLGNDAKCFVIYVDTFVGSILQMAINGVKKDRPLTHDLISNILLGFGAKIERVVINDTREGTFFARLHLSMSNELGTKFIELDARPSDSTVLAIQHQRPIFVTRTVFETVEDMSEVLERVINQQPEDSEETDTGEEDNENFLPDFPDFEKNDDNDDFESEDDNQDGGNDKPNR